MDYENFKEQFMQDVKDRLSEKGLDVNVSLHEIKKVNDSYDAVTITPEGANIGVNLPVDKFFQAVEDGAAYDAVVDKAVDVAKNGIEKSPEFDVASITDYNQMKEKSRG